MGVGPIALKLYQILFERDLLHPGQSVLELGSQEFLSAGSEDIIQNIFSISARAVPKENMKSARAFMEALGFRYVCVDLDGKFDALELDLNFPLPWGWCDNTLFGAEPFNVVTNHGMTEHCFNQEQCFRTIHDVTKLNGIMIHCVPMRGYTNHCFYLYQPRMFIDLAEANNYEIEMACVAIDYMMKPDAPAAELIDWSGQLTFEDKATSVLLCVVLRKKGSASFRFPIQKLYQKKDQSG